MPIVLERSEVRPCQEEVNSNVEFFVRFLLDPEDFTPKAEEFPYHLDLGFCTVSMQELYDNFRLVYVRPDEERQRMLAILEQKMQFMEPNQRESLRSKTMSVINEMEKGERGRVIYRGRDSFSIEASSITYGTYKKVPLDIASLVRQGHKPMKAMHTHNRDCPPAFTDYEDIVSTDYTGRRLLKAELVLCPNVQILALTTADTPTMSRYGFQSLIRDLTEKIEQDVRLKALRQRKDTLDTQMSDKQTELTISINGLVDDDTVKRMTDEEYEEYTRKFYELQGMYKDLLQEMQKDVEQACLELVAFENGLYDESHLQFARDMEILFYISTNMRDFYKCPDGLKLI